jgi:hypothetical protein
MTILKNIFGYYLKRVKQINHLQVKTKNIVNQI